MAYRWKRMLFSAVSAVALSTAGGAAAQEGEDPIEAEGAGAAVSEFAQGLGELNPDQV